MNTELSLEKLNISPEEFRRRLLQIQRPSNKYLTVVALEDNLTVKYTLACQYCINGNNWIDLSANTNTPSINTGQKIMFKSELEDTEVCGKFTISKNCNLEGSCMSIRFGDNGDTVDYVPDYGFFELFRECSGIINVDEDFLPANSVGANAYESIFNTCTNLITPPKLNAMVLGEQCYKSSFYGCSSIQEFSILPATELADGCYYYMFGECTSLTTPPILPALTLTPQCYYSMFFNCNSMEVGPNLPALTLQTKSYYQMFYNCTKLKELKMLATNINATDSIYNWMRYVQTKSGTFYKNSNATWRRTGNSGVPYNWTIITV